MPQNIDLAAATLQMTQIAEEITSKLLSLGERLRLLDQRALNVDYLREQTKSYFIAYSNKIQKIQDKKEEGNEDEKEDARFEFQEKLLCLFYPAIDALRIEQGHGMSHYFEIDIEIDVIIKKTLAIYPSK